MRVLVAIAFTLTPVVIHAQRPPAAPADSGTCGGVPTPADPASDDAGRSEVRTARALGSCAIARTDGVASDSAAIARPVSWTLPERVGAYRVWHDAQPSGPQRVVPRVPGGSLGECSVPRWAVLGGALGAVMAYGLRSFLGHNTGQQLAWGVGLTAFMAGSSAFIAAAVCGQHDA